MKALLLTDYLNLEFTDMPVPDIGPTDVLVRVRACGICGSDVHGWDGSSGRRKPPLVMGHEAAGTIERVGDAVTDLAVGDRVTFDSTIYCGHCWFCRRGDINLCENRRVMGVSPGEYRQHGAFAEYVALPQHIVYPLPDGLSFQHAAMVEPVSIAVHAVNRTPLALGTSAVVVGAGMIGNLVVQTLRIAGCSQIIAVDLDQGKLDLAQQVGATHGVLATEDVAAAVRKLTGGRGADATFEAVGIQPTVQSAIESARKGGSVTLVGNLAANVEFPLQSVVTRELTLYGSCGSSGEYPECLSLIASGAFDLDAIISATVPLDEGASWFQRLYDGEAGLMKVIVEP